MENYLAGFSICSLAMLGVIFIAFVIAKKCMTTNFGCNKNNFLKIETSLTLEPRKNLYVVQAGKEKFLLASSPEGCQFMTKLDANLPQSGVPDNNINKPFVSLDKFMN